MVRQSFLASLPERTATLAVARDAGTFFHMTFDNLLFTFCALPVIAVFILFTLSAQYLLLLFSFTTCDLVGDISFS